jgi:CarD family transcriptional regulator
MMFHQLTVLSKGGGELFIPVDNVQTMGIRPLLEKTEIAKLLDQLKKPSKAANTWRQRTVDNLRLFASGSAFDLAEIVESLTELNDERSLSLNDRKRLDRARRLLVCEISEVMGETEQEAELQVDEALKARKEEVKADCLTKRDLSDACNQNEHL